MRQRNGVLGVVRGRGGSWRRCALALAVLALGALPTARRAGAVHAAGITVTYPAGWNLVGGPDGTVFNASGTSYSLGAGDTAYVTNPGGAPIAGGKGYWMYFPGQTTVTLNGAGLPSVRVSAPAGQYIMIGNPSGTQAATVGGADQVLAWDATAGAYNATTQLATGQGAWAISNAGGSITVTATGPAQSLPADTSVALPAPVPQPAATSPPSSAGIEEAGPCTLGPLCSALAVKLTVDTDQTTVNHQTSGDLFIVATVYSAGQPLIGATVRLCVGFGTRGVCSIRYRLLDTATLARILPDVPPLPVGTVIMVHADASYQGITGTGDTTYTVVN